MVIVFSESMFFYCVSLQQFFIHSHLTSGCVAILLFATLHTSYFQGSRFFSLVRGWKPLFDLVVQSFKHFTSQDIRPFNNNHSSDFFFTQCIKTAKVQFEFKSTGYQ